MGESSFNRRAQVIALVFLSAFFVMALRLIQLQLLRHDYYSVLADQSHQRKYEIAPRRGQIYAQNRKQKVPLVLNRNLKTLYADPRYIDDPSSTADRLSAITKDSSKKYEKQLSEKGAYVVLKRGVDPTMAESIDKLQLAGVGLSDAVTRTYPENSLAAQVVGFVNAEGKGQYGLEEYFNASLAGKPGLLKAKTDSRGIPITSSDNVQEKPTNGNDLVLTIDRNIQAKMESVLKDGVEKYKAKGASAVLIEANSGAIRAMANYPTYDPNKFQDVEDYSVFSNTVAQGLFEPGSNFKMFSMSAGLDSGVVTPDTTYNNTGAVTLDEYTIKNAGGIPNGVFSMKDVIKKSINTGVVYVLEKLGGQAINATAKRKLYSYYTDHFGFGSPTGVELANEPGGHLEQPDGSSSITYANMTFGQGLTATMLQIVSAASAVVNGGTLYRPYIIEQKISPDGTTTPTKPQIKKQNVISAKTSTELKAMMESVVTDGGGFGTKTPGYHIGGKTGTAQIPNPQGGYFDNRDIGSFTGFVPVDKPEFVMMVRIDEPVVPGFAGSAAAGPMFGDIMRWLLQYEGMSPS